MVLLISPAAVQVGSFSRSQVKASGVPSASCSAPMSVVAMTETVTSQVSLTEWVVVPSDRVTVEVAVMTALPGVTPVTKPFSSTVATLSSLLVQVTFSSMPHGSRM